MVNNDKVLELACLFAEKFKLNENRVSDVYGGYCNNQSLYVKQDKEKVKRNGGKYVGHGHGGRRFLSEGIDAIDKVYFA